MLTKEQKAFVLKQLESPLNSVDLQCDGFKITLRLVRHNLRLVVCIWINDWFKGEWCNVDAKHPETKYLPSKSKAFFSPKRKAEIIKAFGKRKAKQLFPMLDEKVEYRINSFSSPKTALAHLIKVSENIELITEMTV